MEQIQITSAATGIRVEGFPTAVKVIALQNKRAERLAHLALHRKDLQFALNCLARINQTPDEVLREAAWRSAVLSFVKCFVGGSRRSQLDMKAVYAGNDDAKAAFSYIKNLRDKHFVHDENGYEQCHPGAALNQPDMTPKILKILTLLVAGVTLEQSAYNNLHKLSTDALDYVVREYDKNANSLTATLEAKDYQELAAMPAVSFTMPPPTEIGDRRKVP
jgi:hypothetical protein